jgi:uncharacterized membrane protein
MEARAKLFGHPIHQMLIVFPLGLLATATIFDVVYRITGGTGWVTAAFYMIAAGVVGGVLAAIFGVYDYVGIPSNTRAKRIGIVHGLGNVVIMGMFAWSFVLRLMDPTAPPVLATALAVAGTLGALVTGWLGGELVDRLSVGVDDGAHLNAPSSLTNKRVHRREPPDRMAAD